MTLTRIGLVILALLTSVLVKDRHFTHARGDGKGIDESCAAMAPFHGYNSQTSNPPFSITFSSNSYTPGTTVSVTIKACSISKPFKGFMIQARRANTTNNNDDMLGSFSDSSTSATTQQACSGKALVHTNSNDKTTLTFDWNPPANAEGPVQFWATFVATQSEYWVAVKSAVLLDQSIAATPDPSTLTPASTLGPECADSLLPNGNFAKDPDCDGNKNCFSDCETDGCTFQIKFRQVGDFGEYSIKTKAVETSDMYAAVGFSSDQGMGQDSVSGCIYQNGNGKVFNAFNTGKSAPEILETDGVTLEDSSYKNGIFSCKFKRTVTPGLGSKRFPLDRPWYLLFARGTYNNMLQIHKFKQPSALQYSLTGTATAGTAPTTPTAPTTATPSGSVSYPSTCGTSKGCISKGSGSSYETVISWEDDTDGNYVLYTIASVVKSPSFMAIGFSSDNKMGGDSIAGCAAASDKSIKEFSGKNVGQSPNLNDDNNVTLVKSKLEDNAMTCTIKVLKTFNGIDITDKWTILFSRGSSSINGQTISLSYHGTNTFVSSQKISSDDKVDIGGASIDYPRVKAHGSLMIAAWVFFASIGIVAARYYKPVWENTLFSQKVWFQIHRTSMILVFCTTAIGFILIFVEVEGWSDLIEDHAYLETHPILGVIVTALTVLNPIMAFFRPHPGTGKRFIFNWAHWVVGTAAHILGVVTIFFGVQLRKSKAPDSLVYILAGYVAWQVLITVILEVMQCYTHDKKEQMYELNDMQGGKAPNVTETPKTISIKQVILLVHVVVLAVISSVLIGFVCVGEDDL